MTDSVLRAAAAFALLYPPISAWFEPDAWLGYVPGFARAAAASLGAGDLVLLHSFGAVEIIIALWILSGQKIFWPSLAATATLLTIVVANFQEFPVLFRDLSIAGLTLGLALKNSPRNLRRRRERR